MSESPADAMPERLPYINYDGHPIYQGKRRSFQLIDRIIALARIVEMASYVVAVRIRQAMTRIKWVEQGDGPHLETLKSDGVVPIRLSSQAKADLDEAARPYFTHFERSRNGIAPGNRTYGDNQYDTVRSDAAELFSVLDRLLDEAGILSSARAYLGCRAELRKVTMQINDEWDTFWRTPFEAQQLAVPPTAFMHIDNTYEVVKAIIYMSDVTEHTGPFGYVPGTNRIKVGLFEGLILRAADIWLDVYPEERPLFLSLPRALRKKAKFGDDIRGGSDWARWLVDHERVFTSKDGDILLFCVRGIHRGGLVESGQRRIIQVMIR